MGHKVPPREQLQGSRRRRQGPSQQGLRQTAQFPSSLFFSQNQHSLWTPDLENIKGSGREGDGERSGGMPVPLLSLPEGRPQGILSPVSLLAFSLNPGKLLRNKSLSR